MSLNLNVTDGVNVNAFYIILIYDSSLLELVSWAHGGYLTNLAIVVRTQNPGYFRLVCTQLAIPPVSGNGVLLNLTFRALTPGLSNIGLTSAEFADPSGNKTLPTRVNGQVQISNSPAPTATKAPTATSTPTATRTATLPMVPSATQTLVMTSTSPAAAKTNTPVPTLPGMPARTDTRPAYPINTPQVGQISTPMLQQTQGMIATQPQGPLTAPTAQVGQGFEQTKAPVSGMTTDPFFIPIRPENSSNTVENEEQSGTNWILIAAFILFDLIALALVLYLVWKRRQRNRPEHP